MDLEAVSEEIRSTLDGLAGLRVPPWGTEKITPPAVIVALPERIDFDQTYARGMDAYPDLPVIVLVGKPADHSTVKAAAAYAAGAGATSVKATLEAHAWVSCDRLDVPWAEFDVLRQAGVDYLGVIFHCGVIGQGA